MLESTGVPLPGETILLAAGVLVQRGHLDLGYTIAFGIAGAVVGDQIGYWVGREGGRPFVLRWGRFLFITPQRLGRSPRTPSTRSSACPGPDGQDRRRRPYGPPYNWELCSSIWDPSVIGRSEWSKAKVATGTMW